MNDDQRGSPRVLVFSASRRTARAHGPAILRATWLVSVSLAVDGGVPRARTAMSVGPSRVRVDVSRTVQREGPGALVDDIDDRGLVLREIDGSAHHVRRGW